MPLFYAMEDPSEYEHTYGIVSILLDYGADPNFVLPGSLACITVGTFPEELWVNFVGKCKKEELLSAHLIECAHSNRYHTRGDALLLKAVSCGFKTLAERFVEHGVGVNV